jgi:hypothetical protein
MGADGLLRRAIFGECRKKGGERGKKTHRNISMFSIFVLSLG